MSVERKNSQDRHEKPVPPRPTAPEVEPPPRNPATLPQFSRPGPTDDAKAREIAGIAEVTPPPIFAADARRHVTQEAGSLRGLSTDAWNRLRRVITAFEAEWERGRVPNLDDYLSDAGPHRVPLLVELLHADLEYRLRGGHGILVGEYLDRYPDLDAEAAADLVVRDFELRRQLGMSVSTRVYLDDFPQLGAELRRRFSATRLAGSDRDRLDTRPLSRPVEDTAGPSVSLPKKFEVIEKLGEGGMGVVWRVRRADLNIDRAVKVIHPSFALNAETRARMLREAQAMAQISHRHAVTIHDVGTDPVPYLEMEYVRGQPLNKLLTPNVPMSLEWTAWILDQLCDVLQTAHDHGIVHRDLKPSNLMLVDPTPHEAEFLKVLDFGIAKFLHAGGDLTPNDLTLGTVLYMSPEQVKDSSGVNASSDIYTIGVILYELLTGCRPFTSRIPQVLYDISYTPAPRFRDRNPNAEVPASVEALVLRCLEKDLNKRPASARALAKEFRQLAFPAPPPPAEPRAASKFSRRLLLASIPPVLMLGGFSLYRANHPSVYTMKPARTMLSIPAGGAGEILLHVAPDNLARRVQVSTVDPQSVEVRVVEDQANRADDLRRFLVQPSLNAKPGRHTLGFRATDGRSVQTAQVVVEIGPPPLGSLPQNWVRAGQGSELVWVDGKAYPRAIERVIDGETVVTALLIPKEHKGEPEPFYMMKDKVWEGLFEAFARGNRDKVKNSGWKTGNDRFPVMNVTGYEAQAFCEWLGGKGRGFLPTDSQWDQAAGANKKDRREMTSLSGRENSVAPAFAVGKLNKPLPVGSATQDVSPFGCRDLFGNGCEWTRLPTSFDPKSPDTLVDIRGASYTAVAPYSFENQGKDAAPSDEASQTIGFRAVIELDQAD